MSRKAIFLDKDGTLIENVPFNVDVTKVRLLDGVPLGLQALQEAGFQLIIVTNQPGVALGHFQKKDLFRIRHHMAFLFEQAGVTLSGFYYCPHHPDARLPQFRMECSCRKPGPGLLYMASIDNQIELEESWMVGDILDDVEAGRRADCLTALIDNGNETEWQVTPLRKPHVTAPNFLSAVEKILSWGPGCHGLPGGEVRERMSSIGERPS
ncbi:MAG: HAD family hydrolase [Syntrophotaleaceae bacterium]